MGKEFQRPEKIFYICTGSKCGKRGGKSNSKLIRGLIKDAGLKGNMEVIKTDCTDRCKFAPVMCVQPDNQWYKEVDEKMATEIFKKALGDSEESGNI